MSAVPFPHNVHDRTPLLVAVENGNLGCVKILLRYKADIEGRGLQYSSFGACTPLFVAAHQGFLDCFEMFGCTWSRCERTFKNKQLNSSNGGQHQW